MSKFDYYRAELKARADQGYAELRAMPMALSFDGVIQQIVETHKRAPPGVSDFVMGRNSNLFYRQVIDFFRNKWLAS